MSDVLRLRNRARFVRPSPRGPIVSRSRLDTVYDRAVGRVLRVLAPGGYGKSTLVARWAGEDDRPVGWVDLEAIDDDAVVLYATLATALRESGVPVVARAPTLRNDHASLDRALPGFVAAVRAAPDPFVLVLDDVQVITSPRSLELLEVVMRNLPPASTVVLIGRAHHVGAGLGRLQLEPGVVDLGVEDLALDEAEARELLGLLGVDLTSDQSLGPWADFEGWVAGLRLAARAPGGPDRTSSLRPGGATASRDVVDYLRHEWSGALDDDDLRFLREAACLKRFTGEMCDEVLSRRGSAARLRRLHRDEFVVLPLDRRDEWFRMHPLLASSLETGLREEDPGRWRTVHATASTWWEGEGDPDLAMEQARQIGDLARCEALVVTHGPQYFVRGLHATVRRWLKLFPHDHLVASPGLVAVGCVAALHDGDAPRARHFFGLLSRITPALEVATAADADSDQPPPTPGTLQAAVLQGVVSTGPARESASVVARARTTLPSGEWHAFSCWTLGGLAFLVGPGAGFGDGGGNVVEILEDGAFDADLAGAPLLQANCLATAAVVAEVLDRTELATRQAREAWVIVERHEGFDVPTTALVAAMGGLAEARAGDHDSARETLAHARQQLDLWKGIVPWFNVLARLALIRGFLLLDDVVAARQLIEDIEVHLRGAEEASLAHDDLRQLGQRVEAAERLHPHGPGSLTPAERKVLPYLATNLSLASIADELFVSRNTVKSHVTSVYRKLGTSSRSEAVAVARQTGLLDQ